MQYQLVLILFNIVIGLAAYFFLREKRHLFRLIIMPVVYAYFLAAFLPYFLAYVPINWVIAFYTVAILLGFLAKGIDSRVQPDVESEVMDAAAWSEADLDYIETRSEREALLNALKFSKARKETGELPVSQTFGESVSSAKNLTPSTSYETSRAFLESALLGSISQADSALTSNPSTETFTDKANDYDSGEEESNTPVLYIKETRDIVDESPQLSTASIKSLPAQEDNQSTHFHLDEAQDKEVEEKKPAAAETTNTPHATVSYLNEYKEEKAALASASGGINHKQAEEKPLPARTTLVLRELPLQPVTDIELNKKAVEEIAQKFAYKISNGHQEEILPERVTETNLTRSEVSFTVEDPSISMNEAPPDGDDDKPLAPSFDDQQEQNTGLEEIHELPEEPVVIVKSDESPPLIAAAIFGTPAERHLELVEASRDKRPRENEPVKFDGAEALLTNQQIPVKDAGEMVLDKEAINDQQEETEDDLMQLDLALVIDRAFQAKFSSDYQKAIRIFEVALNRTPSPKLAQMIAEDIEVMRSKLA